MTTAATGENAVAKAVWRLDNAQQQRTPCDIILSGALGPMVPVTPGSAFTATVAGVGQVSASFTSSTNPAWITP